MRDVQKIALVLLVLCVTAATSMTQAPAQQATFSDAERAWGVFGKMPRRRQGLQQSMYLAIPNQGTRVAR